MPVYTFMSRCMLPRLRGCVGDPAVDDVQWQICHSLTLNDADTCSYFTYISFTLHLVSFGIYRNVINTAYLVTTASV